MKRIMVLVTMMAFTFSVIASSAMAACNCADMSPEAMKMEMPCHDSDAADTAQADDSEKQASQCVDCGCGHCKVPSQTSLYSPSSLSNTVVSSMNHMPHDDAFASLALFGIDNPPKPLS